MTFNIRNGKAPDGENGWERRTDFVCDVVREANPDVLGLQEAFRFQLDDMDLLLPEYAELGTGRDGGTAGEYAAILYLKERFSVDKSGTFWLSETPDVPSAGWGAKYKRVCTWARLMKKGSGECFYIYNTHMDHQVRDAQLNGTKLLMKRISERAHDDPVILMGDFNIDEGDELLGSVQGGASSSEPSPVPLVDTFRAVYPDDREVATYHGFGDKASERRIDYIFISPDIVILDAGILRMRRQGRYPSDHYPVTATLSLPSEK